MSDIDRVISRVLSSGTAAGMAGGLLAGALTSKAGRKLGRHALGAGGIAAIAGLAWVAYERTRRGKGVSLAGGPTLAFLPPAADPAPRRALGLALVRTMIAAARADGKLGDRESGRISAAVQRLDLDREGKALLLDELAHPVDLDALAAAANGPEQAAELYTAALLVIDADTPQQRTWLASLAAKLELPDELVVEIHERVADAARAVEPSRASAWIPRAATD